MSFPGAASFGMAEVQGQIGGQIRSFGVYLLPSVSLGFVNTLSPKVGIAVIVDCTFLDDLLSLGGGPEVAYLDAGGVAVWGASPAGGDGGLLGGRLRFAIHPVVGRNPDNGRRHALEVGMDLGLYTGGSAFQDTFPSRTTPPPRVGDLVILSTLRIGWHAF